MLDYTTDPPTLTINQYMKDRTFELLMPSPHQHPTEIVHQYSVPELRKLTFSLMHYLDIAYDGRRAEDDGGGSDHKLEELSSEERQFYRPFAFLLACLDGNAFPAMIDQYIPDACNIVGANGWKMDDIRTKILAALPPPNPTQGTPP